MPFASYTKVTRADSDAIFAYLRSIPPVKQPNRQHDLRFPYNNRSLILGWRTLFFNEGEYKPDPTKSAEWNRGAYLVEGLGHCGMCHTADQRARRQLGIAGLRGRPDPDAELVRAFAHLEQEAGLGDWSIQDITDLLQTGVSSRGAVYGPMAEVVYNSLQYLTDDDTRAMAVYLKSLARAARPPDRGAGLPTSRKQPADQPRQDRLRPRMRELPWRARARACRRTSRRSPTTSRSRWSRRSTPIRMVLNGGYPPGTAGNPMPYGMPPFAQTALRRRGRRRRHLHPHRLGQSRRRRSRRAQANELRSAPLN